MKTTVKDRKDHEAYNFDNMYGYRNHRSNAVYKTQASRAVRRASHKDPENADGRVQAHSDYWGFPKEFRCVKEVF